MITMRQYILRIAMFCVSAFSVVPGCALSGWYSNWSAAVSKARAEHKPLVALFAHEGCGECTTFESTLSANSARNAFANAVCVRLEFTDYPELASQYAVTGTPTMLVFTPDTGYSSYVAREVGVQPLSQVVSLGKAIGATGEADKSSTEERKGSVTTASSDSAKPASSSTRKSKLRRSRSSRTQTTAQTQYAYPYSPTYTYGTQPVNSSSFYYYPQQQQYYRSW